MAVAVTADNSLTDIDLRKDRIRIANRNGEYHLIAARGAMAGEALMKIEGELATKPCRFSVQVARNIHIAPPSGLNRDAGHDRHLWRFLNHSCKPNSRVIQRVLVAIAPIAEGEEITLDYNSNEYDMATPFRCHCGHCDGGEIRGYRHLSPAERKRREHRLAEYLRDALEQTNV